MKQSKLSSTLAISLCSGASLCVPYHAYANGPALEEVVVTAQKRTESISDTPLSIQAIGGDEMESLNILEMQDLAELVTNITFSNSSGPSFITIRGMGTGPTNTAAEQSVGMYVDGIYASRGYQFNAPFLDIERVEVIKGPQGVLAGKNSVAGAVVIHSRRPTEETEGYVRTSYDFETDGYAIEGAVSGALTDNFYARLTGMYNYEDGWLDTNTRYSYDGEVLLKGKNDQNTNKVDVMRLSMVWDASDTLSFYGKLESSNRKTKGVHFGVYDIQPGAEGDQVLADFQSRDPEFGFVDDGTISNGYVLHYDEAANTIEANNDTQYLSIDAQSATGQFDWEIGELGTLTGITGYSTYKSEESLTQAMAPIDWIYFEGKKGAGGDQLDQFTQEFRLVSPGGATIDWLAGMFYMDRTIKQDGYRQTFKLTNQGFPDFADFTNVRYFQEDTTTWSAVAQVTWNVSDTLRASLGGRYTDESKKRPEHSIYPTFLVESPLNQLVLDEFGIVPFTTQDIIEKDVDDTNFDPSVSVQWDVRADTMLYASYSGATKAGGFNSGAPNLDDSVFDPEKAESYEAGVKAFLMDDRLNVNVAVFLSQFDDLQVSALDSNTNALIFQNAAKATSQGVETDFRFAATESLELGGALAYLDATYDDYPGAPCSVGVSRESDCDLATDTRNAKGDSLRFAPEWTGNLYADYRWNLSNGMQIGLRSDFVYSDSYYLTAQNDPYAEQDSFVKINLLAELRSADDSWVVSVVGKNVTDENVANFGNNTPLEAGAYWANQGKPRQIFLNAQYNF
jgi:iron complex outermembrane recepter protein